MQTINIIAIILAPVMAVLISIWVQNWLEKLRSRRNIFTSLMSTRHYVPHSEEIVRALNMIDVVFHDEEKIRSLWHEYFDMLSNPGLNNEIGWTSWNAKRGELITEMAKVVKFGKKITLQDVQRVYAPVGQAQDLKRARELGDELLRVLKESKGIVFTSRVEDETSPVPPILKR